ncbi:putative colanic acid biosysnthesis UDP-glucose lipid carrier transferase [Pseudomonas sp. LAMO17WK12:I6]|uniref:undecaprenyl-phosphate glucose phosphotransferase n=1 Tax=unclassified Pseudomonas TaxID=196821 RepID=UPI000BD7A5ED|nr:MULTISPECIES: undecaprenyl-phosphate glucose phosphotransferase [unclassified Pseudomonas]SNY15825.1 putative colanic acid biosysnthesis UDP-glucose lipid carrier transferase [Pseudomonas sp. LAMO17WK12:I5]SNY29455.1 putative colanic acid biosysnthesis UDP-glucose lipid carrier transferase [Pseudomonas sp. LAMO17WK12:I6]
MELSLRINRNNGLKGLTFWGQWALAQAFIVALLFILAERQTGTVEFYYRMCATLAVLASVPAYTFSGVYRKQDNYLTGLGRLFMGWSMTMVALAGIAFVCKADEVFSREVTLSWAVYGFLGQALMYAPLHAFSKYYQRSRTSAQKTLIVGTGELALGLAKKISQVENLPLVGLVSNGATPTLDSDAPRVVGDQEDLLELIKDHDIRRLYITLPLAEAAKIEAMYVDLLDANVDVVWVPDLNSLTLLNHSVKVVDGLPAICLNESPLTSRPTAALSKSLVEKGVALLAIILLSPVLLFIALAVKINSPGPVFFKQDRHGWNGKVIQVWKFRSMRVHDDREVVQASRNDTRITAVGRFIRRTSLDELPQLFNVLQGQMALVGPRPHAVAHNHYYSGKILAYMARHRIKPGITGLAQISGCRGETDTIDKMQRRVEMDLHYINNWSLWLDLKILVKTPFTLLSKDIY